MPLIYWSPFAITYLVQLVLLGLVLGYFVFRVLHERRNGGVTADTACLTSLFFWLSVSLSAQFLSRALNPDLATYLLPWVAPAASLSLISFLGFAYVMPKPLVPLRSVEARLMMLAAALLIAADLYIAVDRLIRHGQGFVEYRSQLMDIPTVSGFLWAFVVFIRQFHRAAGEAPGGDGSVARSVRRFFSARPLERDERIARMFLLFTLIPIVAHATLFARAFWLIEGAVAEIVYCWAMLALQALFAMAYLNTVPERTTFLLKLSGVSLSVLLVILASTAWLLGPTWADAYPNTRRLEEKTALRFEPTNEGGYTVRRTAFAWDEDYGARFDLADTVELPFPFPFYGETETRLYPNRLGQIGFRYPGYARDAVDRFGAQPALFPLFSDHSDNGQFLAPLPVGPGPGFFVRTGRDKALLTWRDMPQRTDPDIRHSFQVALYPNGVIEFVYDQLPAAARPRLFREFVAPLLAGITPGWRNGEVMRTDLTSGLPKTLGPGVAVMDDFRIDFYAHLDRVYRPIAAFVVVMSALILLAIPLFLKINLSDPLARLLAGVERFRDGGAREAVPITYRDEIGYLTGAFNDLAQAQRALIDTLEQQVAERTKAAAQLADKAARLEERSHLSRDLHDAVSQSLFSSSLLAETLPRLVRGAPDEAERMAGDILTLNRNALAEMRSLLLTLRPERLTDRPFNKLVRELAADFTARHRLPVGIETGPESLLPGDVQIAFYRILQEALNNVAKHAHAGHVTVRADALPTQAFLSIADDGIGVKDGGSSAGLGLEIMRERIEEVGGTLEIGETPGGGTTIVAIWYAGDHG